MQLYSESFLLKKIIKDDLDNYLKLVTNTKVMQLISGKPYSQNDGIIKFNELLEANNKHNKLGYFSIYLKSTNQFVGYTKLIMLEKDKAELGYMFLPDFWGKGYGSEISTTMVEYARNVSALKTIIAIIDPQNVASKKILLNCGFYLYKVCDMDGLPTEIYHLQNQ